MTFQALLFCPDEKTARVTTQVLTELEFGVEACSEPFAAVKKLMGQHFDAVVVDCENEQNATLLFKSARNSNSNQGALAVAVVEGQAGVASAFRIGANLVLTKPINVEQAKSTLRVARGLLRKGAEAGKPASPAVSASPTAPAQPKAPTSTPAAARPTLPAVAIPVVAPSVSKPAAPAFRPVAQAAPAMANRVAEPPVSSLAPSAGSDLSVTKTDIEQPQTSANSEPAKPPFPHQPLVKPSSLPTTTAKAAISTEPEKPTTPSASSTGKVPIFQAKPVLRSGIGIGGGAASAPAPAKEIPNAPLFEDKPEPKVEDERKKQRKPAPAEELFAAPATSAATAKTAPIAAPSFAALGSDPDSQGGGARKTAIIVVVLALLLAAAGYFGYTKFYAGKRATPAPASPQTQPTAPETQPLTSTGSNNLEASAAPSPTPAPPGHPSPAVHSSAAGKETSTETEPEVVVTHPETEKALAVRTDAGRHAKPQAPSGNSEVSAPSVLGTGGASEAALSTIVESAPVAMPKVAAPQTLKVSQGVTEGLLIRKVPPSYPRQAIQMHVQGAVLLQAMIDKQGRISSVKILKGDPILARAAVDAVSQWRYKPYFLDGQPVDIQTQITVNFKLP